jgi:hypothetical protein
LRRGWSVDDPPVEQPVVMIDEPAVGFSTLTGESVGRFPEEQSTERSGEVFELIREQTPGTRLLLVVDTLEAHPCEYTRRHAHHRGIDHVVHRWLAAAQSN